jgi:ribosome-binding factor A
MKTHRLARVAEAIREVASETILYELHDPRVKFVTVTRAEVSGDLQHAKVYVSIMGTPKEQQLTLRGLKHAAGYVQSKLAKRLQTRFTPVLQFVLDQGVKHSIEMTRLINEALAQPGERDKSVPPTVSEPGGRDTLVPQPPAGDAPPQAGSADGTVEEDATDS